jgi:hypothetical protein
MHNTPYEQRRVRALCLAGIVAVSACAGVLIGRYSTVVFPLSSGASVAAQSKPQPARQTATQPARSLAEQLNQRSQEIAAAGKEKINDNNQPASDGQKASGAPKTDHGQTADSPAPRQSAAVESLQKSESAVEPPEDNKIGGATVLNPGAKQQTRDARKVPDTVSQSDTPDAQTRVSGEGSPQISECARRYASFRESDGTYQPYGSSQRRVCPLLR